jgi:hypothetical protein
MTDHPITKAFGEGLDREHRLFADREDWSPVEWWERKLFLDDEIEAEDDQIEKARLHGRLMAVQAHGRARFGDALRVER